MSISTVEQTGTLAAGEKSPPIRLDLYRSGAQSRLRLSLTASEDCVIHGSYGSNAFTNPDAEELTDEDYGNLTHALLDQDHDEGSMLYEIPVNWAARRYEFQVENTSGNEMEYTVNLGGGNE